MQHLCHERNFALLIAVQGLLDRDPRLARGIFALTETAADLLATSDERQIESLAAIPVSLFPARCDLMIRRLGGSSTASLVGPPAPAQNAGAGLLWWQHNFADLVAARTALTCNSLAAKRAFGLTHLTAQLLRSLSQSALAELAAIPTPLFPADSALLVAAIHDADARRIPAPIYRAMHHSLLGLPR